MVWTLLFPADVQKESALHEKHEKNGWGGVGTEKDVIGSEVGKATKPPLPLGEG